MIAAILQYYFFKVGPLLQVLISIGIALVAYLFLYGIEFAWKFLIAAPVAIDRQQREEFKSILDEKDDKINDLESKLKADPLEEQISKTLAAKLINYTNAQKNVLLHILLHGQEPRPKLDQSESAIVLARNDGILIEENRGGHYFYAIKPHFVKPLYSLLSNE